MPNINIINFYAWDVYEGEPIVLEFTIENNGIWIARNVTIIVMWETENLVLYNNTIILGVDISSNIRINTTEISTPGVYVLTLTIDPNNSVKLQVILPGETAQPGTGWTKSLSDFFYHGAGVAQN